MKFIIDCDGIDYNRHYSARDICVSIVEHYSLTEDEVCAIFKLAHGETYTCGGLTITKVDERKKERRRGVDGQRTKFTEGKEECAVEAGQNPKVEEVLVRRAIAVKV